MVFAEDSARLLLVLHTAVAVACVGAATHLAIWLRGYRRGVYARTRAVRRFAWLSVILYAGAFFGGNLIYPTYKVRVRTQFLEDPAAVTRAAQVRAEADQRAERIFGPPPPLSDRDPKIAPPTEDPARTAAKLARWFDTKEHWVALGFAIALALAFILAGWKPSTKEGSQSAVLGPIVFWLAVASAAAAWSGAIIGVVVSSYRAVGGL